MNDPTAISAFSTQFMHGLRWRSPIVRDLAWCIGSPPLAGKLDDAHIWPDDAWCELQLAGFEKELDALDAGACFTRSDFERSGDRRLGAWFEFLIAQWLERDDRYELVARNVAVRRDLPRGGCETLGELDLVVRNLEQNITEHWEVAVKFYLGVPGVKPAHQWVGPGQKDRLDLKLARVCDHQLPLSSTPGARALLKEKDVVIDRSRAVLKGRLFYPLAPDIAPPASAAPGHLQGWWARTDDFANRFAQCRWRWRQLSRLEWLAPVAATGSAETDALSFDEFAASDGIRRPSRPRMVVALADGNEVSRGFVVPDTWGKDG